MDDIPQGFDALTAWGRILITLLVVFVNGFFVAAEFALVKVRMTQLHDATGAAGGTARYLLANLDRYLSACQLGITLASLVLGWLAEPAVAQLLLAGAAGAGLQVDPNDPIVHAIALTLALGIVTILHMTIGEQAPKIWAIHRAYATTLRIAVPLQIFATLFRPFIWVINGLSNALLLMAGLTPGEMEKSATHTAGEIKRILKIAADAGEINRRQLELARNVIEIMDLEVRHILMPRVDVDFLSLRNTLEENLQIVQDTGHSRFPLCEHGLDTVVGMVHSKEILAAVASGQKPDLRALARKPQYVSDTQPLSRFILQLQRSGTHSCVVVDEHGTAIGLAFLEDAIEEIVGPIRDEFDEAPSEVTRLDSGAVELPGSTPLPEALLLLDIESVDDESDTIGGYVVAQLGRLARKGDSIDVDRYRVSVVQVAQRRIARLRFEPIDPPA